MRLSCGVFVVLSLACTPPEVRCGAGTTLVGAECVVSPDDGGMASDAGRPHDAGTTDGGFVELPVTAIISPIEVVEGFAACPTITVGFASGRSAQLILDPTYVVPVDDTLRIDKAGFSLTWTSADGRVRTGDLPRCRGAVVGLSPGAGPVTLSVDDGRGTSRVVGTAMVRVAPLPATVAVEQVRIVSPATYPPFSELSTLVVGETRELDIGCSVEPWPTGAHVRAVPEALRVESSDPATLEVSGLKVRGLRPGAASLRVTYTVGQRTVAKEQPISVLAVGPPESILFGLPLGDDGRVLSEDARLLERVPVGTCFSTGPWGLTVSGNSSALRSLDAEATVSIIGSGLVASGPQRFCAMTEGDGAIRACAGGLCQLFGYVVVAAPRAAPSVELTLPMRFSTGSFGAQTVCLELQVTAAFSASDRRDVTQSPALRFADPFGGPSSRMQVVIDRQTGLPARMNGRTCFTVEVNPGLPSHGLRVFYAGGQASAQVTLML